jgi:hypothetical protein
MTLSRTRIVPPSRIAISEGRAVSRVVTGGWVGAEEGRMKSQVPVARPLSAATPARSNPGNGSEVIRAVEGRKIRRL